jgi:hypothetical protein
MIGSSDSSASHNSLGSHGSNVPTVLMISKVPVISAVRRAQAVPRILTLSMIPTVLILSNVPVFPAVRRA